MKKIMWSNKNKNFEEKTITQVSRQLLYLLILKLSQLNCSISVDLNKTYHGEVRYKKDIMKI